MTGVSVRIAVVSDPDDHLGGPELAAVRARLGPDIEWWSLPPSSPTLRDLAPFDGLWLTTGSSGDDGGGVLAAVRWAREHGIPLLASGDGFGAGIAEFCSSVLGVPGPSALTPALLAGLVQRGWTVGARAQGGEPLVLTLRPAAFLVLTRFRPEAGVRSGAPPHPVAHAFVESARRRAGYRQWWLAEQARLSALAAAEAEPRPYVHQMRGPRHRWWRPLLALTVTVASWLLIAGLLTAGFWAGGLLPVSEADFAAAPWGSLWGNLLLAALIPATLLGLWAGHRRSPWRVVSVTRRIRWRWTLWCCAVVTPLWAAYLAISWVVFDQEVLPRPEQWAGLVVVTLLTTPLQAAGEEILFRGGLVQSVGSWFRSPVVALVVTTILSTGLFAAAHGSADPWIVVELGSLAVFGCYLAWRTGGLEAVIVIHVVNNVLITVSGALLGGLEESYVDGTTTGSPVSAGMNVAVTGLVTALLLWGARRRGMAPSGWLSPSLG